VVSAGAILSAALLLNSANDKHPRGMANSSDMVGRNYMRHNNLAPSPFPASRTRRSSGRPWPSFLLRSE
jgi:choline dehydrogenase-like flavoprotein